MDKTQERATEYSSSLLGIAVEGRKTEQKQYS